MKLKLLPFLLLLPFLAFTQTKSSIDLITSVDYSHRVRNLDSGLTEVGKMNWRAGFNFNRKLKKAWYLKTGLRVASVGYRTNTSELRWGSQHDGNGGFDPNFPGGGENFKSSTDHLFLEIPIALRYEWGESKWTPFLEAGLAPSYYLRTRTSSQLDDGPIREDSFDGKDLGLSALHLVGLVSFGINYSFAPQWQAFAQPTLRYHINPFVKAPISEHLYNFGVELGVRKQW